MILLLNSCVLDQLLNNNLSIALYSTIFIVYNKEQMQDIKGLYYVPQFISKEEETYLVEKINQGEWNLTLKRRTQHYGYRYSYQKVNTLEKTTQIPGFFIPFKARIQQYIFQHFHEEIKFDQLLVNEYEPGQGISSHIDNKILFEDMVVSLSLNSSAMMVFQNQNSVKVQKLLNRRSLLVLSGEGRLKWKHSIPNRKKDNGIARGTRLSITLRKVKQEKTQN